MKVGLIGHGRLGQLIERYLGQDTDLLVYDSKQETDSLSTTYAKQTDLNQVCQTKIIILAVPISAMKDVLEKIAPLVSKDTLILDTCSVKVHPTKLMQDILPENVQILGTHPMFGPDSAAKTLFGSKIVLCPLRTEEKIYQSLKGYLETHGLKVIESSPEDHDRQISSSLLMTHMIGRVLMELEQRELDIDTKGYRRLMKILDVVENDSWQLFKDMNDYNPFAQDMRDDFIQAYHNVVKRLTP